MENGRQDIPSLQQRVRDALNQLQDLKNAQPLTGDSWIFYRNNSPNTWDLDVSGTGQFYNQLFKMTVNVADTQRGFANMFYYMDYDYLQNMSMNIQPAVDEPYSFWVRLSHATYTADPGRLRVKFYLFSPQEGTLSIAPV